VIVLLDTNILIDALRRRHGRPAQLAETVERGHVMATSAINVGEVYAGMRAGEEARTGVLFSSLECYPVTAAIAQRAGRIKNNQARIFQTFALADIIVAATALEHSLALMTDNRKDFPFPELVFFPE
jgi:predicted nucleic acid-binding protein